MVTKPAYGGADPTKRRPRGVHPTVVLTVTVPLTEADEARELIKEAAARAGMNATRWAADRLLAAARRELDEPPRLAPADGLTDAPS